MATTQKNAKLAVVAVGGNSLIQDEKRQTVPDQYQAACHTMVHIADMIEEGYNVIITHGNGPQVGFILLRSEIARHAIHPVPLDSCVADTQGAIGYNFQMALGNELRKRGIQKEVVTVVTQVLVDKDDPSFLKPSKPIGKFYTQAEAMERKEKDGWDVMEDAGRGWRRVVASPLPVEIIEESAIKALAEKGFIVVAVGGGGIPVIRDEQGNLKGVAAVIDKDYASALLASRLKADVFVISTAVEKAYLNFGKPDQKPIEKCTASELAKYVQEGHFKPGSMLPKCKAIINFLKEGGKHAIITNPENLARAVRGQAGTHIFP
ncbi:MAG: Carbamate kinase [Candidatus Ozemobacter sibiricus]|jgi:carbamate kinase|uniref:Carbamate kinase n=1 Tax=Candidatus Ozemobacter sibiricus TaxID=2268124 RepID=A0A367ZKG5_9BACT|nr:MAG: Carbamate kinase [Candidatus Ozemobacter sibiricus]